MLALALLQPHAYVHSPLISRGPTQISRVADVTASAKILPVVDVGLGVALLRRAASATGAEAAVLASAGGLAIFNLARSSHYQIHAILQTTRYSVFEHCRPSAAPAMLCVC